MIVCLFTSLIAVLLAVVARREGREWFLLLSFVVITVFLALGFEWGNDVTSYQYFFNRYADSGLSSFAFSSFEELNSKNEFGWVSLNILFKPIGFYGFRAVLFIIENYIVYRFIKKYVNKEWYWLAVFIYVFNPYYMIMSSSMMRQWLAMCLILWAFDYIAHNKIYKFIIIVLIAMTIHRSSLLCLLLPLLNRVWMRPSNTTIYITLLSLIVYFFASSLIVDNVVQWLSSEEIYSNYSGSSYYHSDVGINSIVKLSLYVSLFYFACKNNLKNGFIMKIPILYSLILPFFSYSTVAARLGFYFTMFMIAAFPLFISESNLDKSVKKIIILAFIVFNIYSLYTFFTNPIYAPFFVIYKPLLDL